MRRERSITLNRDRDYPRFSQEFFRRRWRFAVMLSNEGEDKPFTRVEGDAAFAATALVRAVLVR